MRWPIRADRTHVDRLIAQAADAVQRAGGDPALTTTIDNLVAANLVAQGELDKAHREVRHRAQAACSPCTRFVRPASPPSKRSARSSVATSRATSSARGRSATRPSNAIEASGRTVPRSHAAMSGLAWLRGDFDELHTRADKADTTESPRGTPLTGHVINADGTPAADATIVAWTGAARRRPHPRVHAARLHGRDRARRDRWQLHDRRAAERAADRAGRTSALDPDPGGRLADAADGEDARRHRHGPQRSHDVASERPRRVRAVSLRRQRVARARSRRRTTGRFRSPV